MVQLEAPSTLATQLELPAELGAVDQAAKRVGAMLGEAGLERIAFQVEVGVREALVNAVVHGSQSDPVKTVRLGVRLGPSRLEIDVEDEGEGFDHAGMGREPPPPDAESGRGLPIMFRWFDEVIYNDKGNRVRLVKRVGGDASMLGVETRKERRVVAGPVEVTAAEAEAFKTELKSVVNGDAVELAIDLGETRAMDSVGLGLLIAAHNSLRKNGGSLTLVNVSGDILELLRIMRLDKHMHVEAKAE